MVKNDRMDALNIAKNLASGSYKSVYVPDEEDVEIKEYIRMIHDFKKELKRVKQEICAFVLRHGYQYDGKSKWTIRYMNWIRELEMSEIQRETLNEYIAEMENLNDKINRFMNRIDEMYQSERYHEKVSKLRCFKGIETFAAMTIQVETADFERFPSAKAYASYTGLTTGEHSSGDKNNRIGITKQGNTVIRKTLVECAQSLVKGNVYAKKSQGLKSRQKGMDVNIIAYADKATERLKKKYQKLIERNVPRNKVIQMLEKRVETISDDCWKKIIEDFQKLHENEERIELQLELEETQRQMKEVQKEKEKAEKKVEEKDQEIKQMIQVMLTNGMSLELISKSLSKSEDEIMELLK